MVDYLPSPADIDAVEGVNPNTGERDSRELNDEAPFSALAFKVMSDPYVGRLCFFRVYSGAVNAGSYIYNASGRKNTWSDSADARKSSRRDRGIAEISPRPLIQVVPEIPGDETSIILESRFSGAGNQYGCRAQDKADQTSWALVCNSWRKRITFKWRPMKRPVKQ